jgi:hypothetical protein
MESMMANIQKYMAKEPGQVQTGEAAASAAAAGKDDYSESADAFTTASSVIAAKLQQSKHSFDVGGMVAQMDSTSINRSAAKASEPKPSSARAATDDADDVRDN